MGPVGAGHRPVVVLGDGRGARPGRRAARDSRRQRTPPVLDPTTESDLPAFDPDAETFTYDAWHGYWHLARQGTPAAYPFGFGFSYTSFVLEGASAQVGDDGIRISGSLRNSGARTGTDVVQVYAHREGSDRPDRLVGFERLELDAGETAALQLVIPLATLAERDTDSHSMIVRPGTYQMRVARVRSDDGWATRVTVAG